MKFYNQDKMVNHKHSTYALILILGIISIAIIGVVFTSQDIDEVCSEEGKILKRSGGSWVCADDETGNGSVSVNGS